jgi:dephospho-CoA kinase
MIQLHFVSFCHSGTPAFREIISRCWGVKQVAGSDLVMDDGQLDRKALGALVFDHPPSRRALNKSAPPAHPAPLQERLFAVCAG